MMHYLDCTFMKTHLKCYYIFPEKRNVREKEEEEEENNDGEMTGVGR